MPRSGRLSEAGSQNLDVLLVRVEKTHRPHAGADIQPAHLDAPARKSVAICCGSGHAGGLRHTGRRKCEVAT